jgi:hypothetical protein
MPVKVDFNACKGFDGFVYGAMFGYPQNGFFPAIANAIRQVYLDLQVG